MRHRKTAIASAVSIALFSLGLSSYVAAQSAPAKAETPTEKAAREKAEAAKKAEAEKQAVETIVVTATGRDVAASRIPYNVTAISEEQLRDENITDIKKLIAQSASINAPANSARFAESVTVRGLNISPVNANNLEQFVKTTLAYYLDSTPLPNIGYRIKDIARVETLLGPQGTLYGAGSLGGAVRYITNQPQFNKTTARIDTSFYKAERGDMSNDTHVVLNTPLSETVAFRASISGLNEGGYTDRVTNAPWRTGTFAWTNPGGTTIKNDDWQRVTSGKFAVAWQATKDLKFTVTYLGQDQNANGTNAVSLLPLNIANATTPAQITATIRNPATSPCNPVSTCRYNDNLATPFAVDDKTVISRYAEFARRKFNMSVLDIDWSLPFANLKSSTSTFEDNRIGQGDYASAGWVFYWQLGDAGAAFDSNRSAYMTFNNSYKGLNHETRLTSKGTGPLSWIAGLYYTKQDRSLKFSEFLTGLDAYNGVNRTRAGGNLDEGYRENLASEYKETAAYGELGYKITPQWLVNFGGRVFSYDDTAIAQIRDYSFDLVNNNVQVTKGQNNQSYYKFNTSYQFTDDLLGYATYSQGFRRGGTNGFRNVGTNVVSPTTQQFEPDSTDNIEAGLKGYLFNRQLYLQVNYFQIDWKNVQTYYSQDIAGFPVNGSVNGPDARTKGWEMAGRWRLNNNFQLQYSGARTEGEWSSTRTVCLYTNNTACRTWSKGGILGATPTWKHNYGLRFNTTLDNGTYLWSSLSGRYTGEIPVDRTDRVGAVVPKRPAYTLASFSVGAGFGPIDLSLWVQNLSNKRVIVSSNNGTSGEAVMGQRVIYTLPRTVGVNMSYTFK